MDAKALEPTILRLNKLAMTQLRQDNFNEALHNLKSAKSILEAEGTSYEVLKLLSITLNNLSCLYKKKG
jgi:hypothetical protein